MSPDNSRYFVTCQHIAGAPGTVSVIDAHADTLIKQIQVGSYPQEMAVCTSKNYLFVACMEDADNPSPNLGSIYVIDYNTLDVVTKIYGDFFEPHDMAVDNQDGLLFIASRNADNGIPSHHTTLCGANAGWYSVYNLNTLTPVDNKRYEVTNDAYAISPRFK
jgi:YVTN family beta-propeller protein